MCSIIYSFNSRTTLNIAIARLFCLTPTKMPGNTAYGFKNWSRNLGAFQICSCHAIQSIISVCISVERETFDIRIIKAWVPLLYSLFVLKYMKRTCCLWIRFAALLLFLSWNPASKNTTLLCGIMTVSCISLWKCCLSFCVLHDDDASVCLLNTPVRLKSLNPKWHQHTVRDQTVTVKTVTVKSLSFEDVMLYPRYNSMKEDIE